MTDIIEPTESPLLAAVRAGLIQAIPIEEARRKFAFLNDALTPVRTDWEVVENHMPDGTVALYLEGPCGNLIAEGSDLDEAFSGLRDAVVGMFGEPLGAWLDEARAGWSDGQAGV